MGYLPNQSLFVLEYPSNQSIVILSQSRCFQGIGERKIKYQVDIFKTLKKGSVLSRKSKKGKACKRKLILIKVQLMPVWGRREIKSMIARHQNSRSQRSKATEPGSISPCLVNVGASRQSYTDCL